jgi:asparagine synthetase B (glutamine-hydrolysing)
VCGIAATLPCNDDFIRYSLSRQETRGPDQKAEVNLGFCSLGVNRLAISGLDGGDQPLSSEDGSVVVVFNGAIYNAQTLVNAFRLEPKSTNDGEVIAHAYYQDGPLGSLLASSVEEQIPREVPWGCMLSGGVDSSLIARSATDAAGGVKTFTCGTEGSADLLAAREVAELLGTTHHEEVVDPMELPACTRCCLRSCHPLTVGPTTTSSST